MLALRIYEGRNLTKEFELRAETLSIGAPRVFATIEPFGNFHLLRAAEGSPGMFVNGVLADTRLLRPGDLIRIGSYSIEVVSREGPTVFPPAEALSGGLDDAKVLSQLMLEGSRAEALIEHMEGGVLLADLDFRVLAANFAAAVLLGRDSGIQKGLSIFELFADFSVSPDPDVLRAKWRPAGIRFRLKSARPQAPKCLAGALLPRPGRSNAPEGVFVALREASEVERAAEQKTLLLANLSHKLRGPLTVIQGDLHLLRMRERGSEVPEDLLGEMERNSAALCHLLDQFSEYAELESRALRAPEGAETANIDAVVREIADTAASAGASKGIAVSLDVSQDLPLVRGSREDLIRAFRQIVDNSVKFCDQGGRIQLRAETSDGSVIISVADDGPGIPPEEIQNVFEPYHQVSLEPIGEIPGAGLGLAIARGILERLGGTIEIRSPWGSPNRGTLVTVRLPACAVEAPANAEVSWI